MKAKSLPLLLLATVAAVMAFFLAQREQAAPLSAATYTGLAYIDGPLQLDLSLTPAIATPRDMLQVTLRLTNRGPTMATPDVELRLPATLSVESSQLPAGVTLNLTDNSLHWLAIVPGQGSIQEITIPLQVAAADLTHPEQTVAVTLRTAEAEQSTSAMIWIGVLPRVEQITNPLQVSVGQTFTLEVQSSGPGPLAQTWDLGDGRLLPVNNPSVVYPRAGVYNLSVTVKNPLGSDKRVAQITVVPHVAARFRLEDDTIGVGQAIDFVNESGGKGPVRYAWDFGDGNTSSEARPQHIYQQPGTYPVRLVAENSFGRAEHTATITVGTPPEASMLVDAAIPGGQRLTGEAIANAEAAQFSWEMGDGRRYDGSKVNHAYRQSGNYYVTLVASNEFGTTQVGRWVHVEVSTVETYLPLIGGQGAISVGSSADGGPAAGELATTPVAIDGLFSMESLELPAGVSPPEQLLRYVNEARRQFDLSELRNNAHLNAAAQKHTQDMATTKHNQHVGSDGSTPAERLLWHGYQGGYAGEATAWGFPDPRQAVEFWVNSPSHRAIILNPYATSVGVGHTANYDAPSVWYWTAEFANDLAAADPPALRVLGPAAGLEALNTALVTFTWNWPEPLAPSQQFVIYFHGPGGSRAVGTVREPILGTRYALAVEIADIPALLGAYTWQIILEDGRGTAVVSSEQQPITIIADPTLPTATPVPTAAPTLEPTTSPTATAVPTITPPPATPRPTDTPEPPLIIATPVAPTATP